MAITNEQFNDIKDIINQRDEEYIDKIDNIKSFYEDFLKEKMSSLSRFYKHIINFKIIGFDEYLFNVNYENSSSIKFYVCLTLDDKSINLNRLQKSKNKISKKEKLYNEIMFNNAQDLPFMEDVANDIYKELLKIKQPNDIIFTRNNVIRLTLNEEIIVEIVVSYELEENEIAYYKNTFWNKINILNFYNNFYQKNVQTNNNFCLMIKIFKALEKEIVYAGISQQFISKKENLVETLLYNVPTNYFCGNDIDKVFLRVINYLLNADFTTFRSIDNMFNMLDLFEYNVDECENLCKKILYAYNNFDTIINMTAQRNEQLNNFNQHNNDNDDIDEENTNNQNNTDENPYEDFKNKFKK